MSFGIQQTLVWKRTLLAVFERYVSSVKTGQCLSLVAHLLNWDNIYCPITRKVYWEHVCKVPRGVRHRGGTYWICVSSLLPPPALPIFIWKTPHDQYPLVQALSVVASALYTGFKSSWNEELASSALCSVSSFCWISWYSSPQITR